MAPYSMHWFMSAPFIYCYVTNYPNLVLTDSEQQGIRTGHRGDGPFLLPNVWGLTGRKKWLGATKMPEVGIIWKLLYSHGWCLGKDNHSCKTINQNTCMPWPLHGAWTPHSMASIQRSIPTGSILRGKVSRELGRNWMSHSIPSAAFY